MTAFEVGAAIALGLAVAGFMTAVAAARIRRSDAVHASARHEWQARQDAFDAILEVWRWQTDAGHHLVDLQAPAGDLCPGEGGALAPFWQRFDAAGSAQLEAAMKNGDALDDIEVAASEGHAAKRSFRLRGRPLRDARGAFCGYVGSLHEHKHVDAAPDAAPSTAARPPTPADADHEALGTLVSHDLRAPIRVVEGFTRIVKEDYAEVLDGVGHDHLDRVLAAAGRMNRMIDALLTLSQLANEPIARVPVDLSALAACVVEDLRRLQTEHAVEVEIEPGMTVPGDPTLLRIVLENLLGNAWKYTGNNRSARVAFVRDSADPTGFVVRDNGAGFDMQYADRLFGVFQRLHSASEFPGTGVGLASVRRIVRRHGGEIRAEGHADRGASFHFSLPPGPAEG